MHCCSACESRPKGLGKTWLNLAKTGKNWLGLAKLGKNWQKMTAHGLKKQPPFTQKEMP